MSSGLPGFDSGQFHSLLAELGLTCSPKQEEQFSRYFDLLIEGNRRFNLTRIDQDEIILKHFIDSLYLLKLEPDFGKAKRVLDLGSGAGLPGIALKILCPEVELHCLDSVKKKCDFMTYVITELELRGADSLHGRAEELAHAEQYRAKYQAVVSRALAEMSLLIELSAGFLEPGGHLYAYKGQSVSQELHEAERVLELLHTRVEQVTEYELPGTSQRRAMTICRQLEELDSKYPRSLKRMSADRI